MKSTEFVKEGYFSNLDIDSLNTVYFFAYGKIWSAVPLNVTDDNQVTIELTPDAVESWKDASGSEPQLNVSINNLVTTTYRELEGNRSIEDIEDMINSLPAR